MRFVAFLLSVCLLVSAPIPGALAEEPAIPTFWDVRERLVKPDLSSLQRLRFITGTDFPPFNFIDASGRLSGFHIDLARAICAELAIIERCQIQALPWAEHASAMEKGEGEALLAGLAVSDETRQTYIFSRPYMRFPARFVAQKAKSFDPVGQSLAGKTIGIVQESAHARMLRDYFPDAAVKPFPTEQALLAAMEGGQLDAGFGDGMRFSRWLGERGASSCCAFAGGPYLASEYLGYGLAIAVSAEQPNLARALDYALHELSAKGTFAELYLRYFPVSFF